MAKPKYVTIVEWVDEHDSGILGVYADVDAAKRGIAEAEEEDLASNIDPFYSMSIREIIS